MLLGQFNEQANNPDDGNLTDELVQMVTDGLEEVIVTVIEALRERPALALALMAGVAAAIAGTLLAQSRRKKKRVPPPSDLSGLLAGLVAALASSTLGEKSKEGARSVSGKGKKSAGFLSDFVPRNLETGGDLANLAVRLLQNPLVRGIVVRQLRKRLRF